jgi:hypothetical protein
MLCSQGRQGERSSAAVAMRSTVQESHAEQSVGGAVVLLDEHPIWLDVSENILSSKGILRGRLEGPSQPVTSVTHKLQLAPDPDVLARSFSQDRRRRIRIAERSGLKIRWADDERDLTEVFFELHVETGRRLGVLLRSRSGSFSSFGPESRRGGRSGGMRRVCTRHTGRDEHEQVSTIAGRLTAVAPDRRRSSVRRCRGGPSRGARAGVGTTRAARSAGARRARPARLA